jgi:hypothetical protein
MISIILVGLEQFDKADLEIWKFGDLEIKSPHYQITKTSN